MRRPARVEMRSLGSLFLLLCMMLIAASAGAVLHVFAGLTMIEAGLAAVVLLFAFVTLEVSMARRRDRAEFEERCEGLARGASELAREVGELRHRVAAVEVTRAGDLRPLTEPLAQELGELAEVVEDLARSVSAHDALLASLDDAAARHPVPAEVVAPPDGAADEPPAINRRLAGLSDRERGALVREALEAGRVDLYLQPVVTLPQRKVRYYEALSRMRMPDGAIADAAEFLPAARAAGLLPRIDEKLVHACVQVVRRLAARNREVGLFLNIAPETLTDRTVFAEILGYLDANRALASSLMLEVSQAVYRALGPAEQASLSALAERGFRFSLDRIEDLRIDPRGLADRGVRFVKVSADLMLKHLRPGGSHIHPADLADLLARYGIDLVAERIESESIVLDLLDYDVRFGQGFLFSPPRPLRADVLGAERVPEPPAPAPQAAAARGGLSALARAVRRT